MTFFCSGCKKKVMTGKAVIKEGKISSVLCDFCFMGASQTMLNKSINEVLGRFFGQR